MRHDFVGVWASYMPSRSFVPGRLVAMQHLAGIMQFVLSGLAVYPIFFPKPDGLWKSLKFCLPVLN
jgi:hypothetical protein